MMLGQCQSTAKCCLFPNSIELLSRSEADAVAEITFLYSIGGSFQCLFKGRNRVFDDPKFR